jgi:hypothetical protein
MRKNNFNQELYVKQQNAERFINRHEKNLQKNLPTFWKKVYGTQLEY